ncbi:hypothetical protein AWB80_02905 [Caballeronia pedi]|uniref:Uncharacterized protein n=1 Tax=Caballeronia pedi TaxID=1777141 RepID=A0A158B116_9BURK|nr:hypothetical protein [Caballeronia pedi]SAK63703.1 hypothetical protein AWB80_02905 [Caballeronia pedi]
MHDTTINLQAGSVAWHLTKLGQGEFLMELDKGEWSRRFYQRSIHKAIESEGQAAYTMTLCYAIQHDGLGEPVRLFKITRTV